MVNIKTDIQHASVFLNQNKTQSILIKEEVGVKSPV